MHTTWNRTDVPIDRNIGHATSSRTASAARFAVAINTDRISIAWAAFLFLAFSTILAGTVQAQIGGSGSITGVVTDRTGAVVINATVSATNTATNVTTSQTTSSAGTYVLSPLTPGDYTVTITLAASRPSPRSTSTSLRCRQPA